MTTTTATTTTTTTTTTTHLDDKPDEAVDPRVEGEEFGVTIRQAFGGDAVWGGLWPCVGHNGGDDESTAGGNEEDRGRLVGPEEIVTGTAAEQGKEITDGHLEVDHGRNLF